VIGLVVEGLESAVLMLDVGVLGRRAIAVDDRGRATLCISFPVQSFPKATMRLGQTRAVVQRCKDVPIAMGRKAEEDALANMPKRLDRLNPLDLAPIRIDRADMTCIVDRR
jgi:hypothetical protein